jgi:hypothetical protein
MTHDDVWHALPFFVNGTLQGKARADVDAHVASCADCRAEISTQVSIRDAIAREDVRQESTQSSFDHLWSRIQDHEAQIESALEAQRRPATVSSTQQRMPAAGRMKWLVAAVIVEGIGLATLGAMTWANYAGASGAASYRTLSSTAQAQSGGQIRAVFAPELDLRGLQNLLSTSRLSIVGGPTEAGVYTLTLDDAHASVETALAGLRRSTSVRFAEPIDKSRTVGR